MNYVISDLHGCMDKYRTLLKKIRFGPEDTLYFLGDALDRGPAGPAILLDMASRPNVKAILGNHEAMAIQALPALQKYCEGGIRALTDQEYDAIDIWKHNNAYPTVRNLVSMDREQRQKVWNYMTNLPLYREVTVGDRQFVLVHGGLGNFDPARPMDSYRRDELIWCRPEPDTVYFPDKKVILGHTPTMLMYDKTGVLTGKAEFFRTESYIDIDCGCVFEDGRLGCLCLDTMEELYL